MSVELRPFGVRCNLHCNYCYQNPQRDAGNIARSYDMEKMKAAVEAEGGPFSLFGGEPLLLPAQDLEELLAWGHERFGASMIQTNGTLLNEHHIALFKKYKVSVGISMDGPDALNDIRWAGSQQRTRQMSARTLESIERLCREELFPSIIITLHRANGIPPNLARLLEWVRHLDELGVRSMRLHLLESENELVRARYALSDEENIEALLAFLALEKELSIMRLDVFEDMRNMLNGRDARTTCVWNACDPYTTRAVRGVEGFGQRSNCGRTNKDGIDFVKADQPGFERYMALYLTPQEHGGCHACRFFLMCKGQCPGTAIGSDWRNRTEHCWIWKMLFEVIENELIEQGKVPVSRSSERDSLEAEFIQSCAKGAPITMSKRLRPPARRERPLASAQSFRELAGILDA